MANNILAQHVVFQKGETSIFPVSNDNSGGQLVTEYNLLGTQRAMTGPNTSVVFGPSFTRTMNDFAVSKQGTTISVSGGIAIVNGYFVHCAATTAVSWNLSEVSGLSGKLAIGLKTFFSGQIDTQDSLAVDNTSPSYTGIKLVIVKQEELILPSTASPLDEINMDLLLATFTYSRGTISNLEPNASKIQYIDPARLLTQSSGGGEEGSSAIYPDMAGLAPNKIYGLCPTEENGTKKYWEDITDLLFQIAQVSFERESDNVLIRFPRYQIHGSSEDLSFVEVPLLNCDYDSSSTGLATPELIGKVKQAVDTSSNIERILSSVFLLETGKLAGYLEYASSPADIQEAEIKALGGETPAVGDVGKYILVAQDQTIASGDSSTVTAPSTVYIVIPYTPEATTSEPNPATQYIWTSTPIIISPEVPIATSERIGGVRNIDLETNEAMYTDRGYVYVDSNGHMRLRDYAILRSGLLAYALTSDYSASSSITVEEIQNELNDYVNARIAMPKAVSDNSTDPLSIMIIIPDRTDDAALNLTIQNIDSRFGTSVHIDLRAVTTASGTIIIRNCEKVVILPPSNGNATLSIVASNSGIYYSSNVMQNDAISFENCTFWYDKNYATETEMDGQNIYIENNSVFFDLTPSSSGWSTLIEDAYDDTTDNALDVHVQYAPHHFTLDSQGRISELAFVISCQATLQGSDFEEKKKVQFAEFSLPDALSFIIPDNRIINDIRFTSRFGSTYYDSFSQTVRSFKSDFTAVYKASGSGVMCNEMSCVKYAISDFDIPTGLDTTLLYPNKSLVTGLVDTMVQAQ